MLWLDPIPESLRPQALSAFHAGDVEMFLASTSNEYGLELVAVNHRHLREKGIFEKALLSAWVSCRTNYHRWSACDLLALFSSADRPALLAAGTPLPGNGPFRLFRGVAGKGPARRVRGLSWTTSFERAKWFALRFPFLPGPAVFSVTAPAEALFVYSNDRREEEYLIDLPGDIRPRLVWSGVPRSV